MFAFHGYPTQIMVSDNTTTFKSTKFQAHRKNNGIFEILLIQAIPQLTVRPK